MNIAITFHQIAATEAVKGYATEKVGKLQKYLREPMQSHVTLSCENRLHVVEVDVHAGSHRYHAHERTDDMYASIDQVIDKIQRQIRADKDSKKGQDRASSHLLPVSPDDVD